MIPRHVFAGPQPPLNVLKLIRPSRIAAVVIVLLVPLGLANWKEVFMHTVSAPSYIGLYQRHAGIRYGDLPRQSLDVYVPSGGGSARPTVVFWYGGKWQWGSKEQYRFVGAALANSGYVAILPDYRLLPQARFPQFIEDGALAVRWAREHAHEFGGDPRAIFLMGHSAGGHLAATVALDEQYLRHGLEDFKLHPREAVFMGEKLRAVGVPVECRIYGSTGHMAPVLALSPLLRFQARTLTEVRPSEARPGTR